MTNKQAGEMVEEANALQLAVLGATETAKAVQWRYYSYDVWGNARDGYEVNNVFRTPDLVTIPDNVKTDAELFACLKAQGFINKPRLQAKFFETDHFMDYEGTIPFYYKGRPEGEFRREGVR